MCLRQMYTLINPPGVKCFVLVLGAKIPNFKEGSTLYIGARFSRVVVISSIPNYRPLRSHRAEIQGYKGIFLTRVVFSFPSKYAHIYA